MGGKLEFVAKGVGEQVVRGGSWHGSVDADQLSRVVFDGRYHAFLRRIPPLVGSDTMAVAVRAGKKCGMPGGGTRISVVVVAIIEVRALVEEDTESAGAEQVAVTLKVITAELVDHDDHNQLGMSVVGRGGTANWQAEDRAGQ